MNNCKKVCLSLSGGLDSTMLLMYYLSRGFEVRAYSFFYGQKHEIELEKVLANIEFLNRKGFPIKHQIINLEDVFSDSASSLHREGGDIPEGDYRDESMKSTVVENRNIIFSSIIYGKALGWANKTQENVIISQGIHAGDHTIYPDCRPESQNMARELYKISNWGSEKVDFETPFINLHKQDVLLEGINAMNNMGFNKLEIRKILQNTHSCYNPDSRGKSCGKCGTCVERLEAFEIAGIKDPIEYSK